MFEHRTCAWHITNDHSAQSISQHPACLSALRHLEWPSLIKKCGKGVYLHTLVSVFFVNKNVGDETTVIILVHRT